MPLPQPGSTQHCGGTPRCTMQGVDVEYESRRERCARCKDRLQALLPGLSQLAAAGNARAAQLHSQVSEL